MWPLRRQYQDLVGDRVRKGDVGGLLDLGWRWVGTALAPRVGRSLVGPALGTLVVTYRCNLRCRVCDLPRRARDRRRAGERELDTQGLRAVLRDMKAIGTAGVGFTGGEPMLRPDLFELLAYGSHLGLHVHLNTDGLHVAARAHGLLRTGVRSVNVSLDGASAEEHDRARGKAGAFEDAIRALGALRRARGSGPSPRLTAVTVVSASSAARLEAIAETALAAGADRLGILPVHDFGQGEPPVPPEAVRRAQGVLRELHDAGRLDNSLPYVDLLPRALAGESSPLRCYAPHASVVVDCYGDVYPCFPLMERNEPVGRIPLARLWRSSIYAESRRRLEGCRACLWNCHAELNLALPQPRRVLERPA